MSTFFQNPLYWLIGRGAPEADNSAGWWIFRLPSPDCDWMQPAAAQHDYDYRMSAVQTLRRSEADARLWRNWCRAAEAPFDPLVKCHRYLQIARYYPLVREFGGYFWDSELKIWAKDTTLELPQL